MPRPVFLSQWCDRAIHVQDACNLSGVVHDFDALVTELWKHAEGRGTDWVNNHPLCVLFVSKLASLTGLGQENDKLFSEAWEYAERWRDIEDNTDWSYQYEGL